MTILKTRIFPYFFGAILSLAAVVACSHYTHQPQAAAPSSTIAQAQ